MIETLNTALLELQSALLARSLYPSEHPQIASGEEKTLRMLSEILEHEPTVRVFAVEERVVYDGKILPGSAGLNEGLFEVLRKVGVTHLTFQQGLTIDEIRALLDGLSTAKGDDAHELPRLPHLSFASVAPGGVVGVAPGHETPGETGVETDERSQVPEELRNVWGGIAGTYDYDAKTLQDVVSTLSRMISENSRSLVPLAPLKSYDEYTFVHILNVGILTMALGEALGFGKNTVHELGVAALLHDVGKTAVPVEILNKSGRFTPEEFKIMQIHPVEGARILLRTRGVPNLAAVVAYEHHVRRDGGGYPKVPRGWKLNLASRICQVADVYDALRTDRPYRPGMPKEKVAKIMRADVGSYFDEDLLEIFLEQVVANDHSRDVPA